jgi:hypothetical protein
MQFAYEGFTHQGDIRYFQFRGKDEAGHDNTFCLAVRCLLFTQNQVPLQAGPQFCLQLLHTACVAQPRDLDRFHRYCVVAEDFRPLLLERARMSSIKAMKSSARRPFRKPSQGSQVVLQKLSGDR